MTIKNSVQNDACRDSGGRVAKGCPAGPGRPKGSANAVLTRARQWVQERGLPMMIEAAEAGDAEALKCLVTLAMPRQKPSTPPLDCLEGMPLPKTDRELGELAAFLLEKVGAGELAVSDAESLMSLGKRRIDLGRLGRPFRLEPIEVEL